MSTKFVAYGGAIVVFVALLGLWYFTRDTSSAEYHDMSCTTGDCSWPEMVK